MLHTVQLLSVLEKFAAHPRRLSDLKGEYLALDMWNETLQQDDGTIRRETRFSSSADEWVLSGPHFFVGTPLYKTPRRVCDTHKAYDVIDLTAIPDDYLPRTNYIPACERDEYLSRVPRVPWVEKGESEGRRVTDFYRLCVSRGLSAAGERTVQPSVIPPGSAHIDGVFSLCFRDVDELLLAVGLWSSLPVDFFVRSTGKSDLREDTAKMIFLLDSKFARYDYERAARALVGPNIVFRGLDHVLSYDESWRPPHAMPPLVTAQCALIRRAWLVSLDVLAALTLSISLDELMTLYRIQFPVMRQYEAETFYDQTGRIIFTPSKGLSGVGLPRKSRKADLTNDISYGIHTDARDESNIALGWEDVRDMQFGTVTKTFMDDTMPDGPHQRTIGYIAPFFRPDREEDYRVAWEFFERKLKESKSTDESNAA